MLFSIKFQNFSASISTLGAELKSFCDENTGAEYIWQGDPEIWQGSAPILFPIVGRLKDGKYFLNGNTYEMVKHGLVRKKEFQLRKDFDDEKSFVIQSDAEMLQSYPFPFELEVSFKIKAGTLEVTYDVRNLSDDTMYFTLGSHPAFALPIEDGVLEDYYIEFEKKESLDCYYLENELLCEEPIRDYLKNKSIIPITASLFDNDALIFKNIQSNRIYIKHKRNGQRLCLETGGTPHLGIWAKPNAPYVCLEPWYSCDESPSSTQNFAEKDGILSLEKGAEFKSTYTIVV